MLLFFQFSCDICLNELLSVSLVICLWHAWMCPGGNQGKVGRRMYVNVWDNYRNPLDVVHHPLLPEECVEYVRDRVVAHLHRRLLWRVSPFCCRDQCGLGWLSALTLILAHRLLDYVPRCGVHMCNHFIIFSNVLSHPTAQTSQRRATLADESWSVVCDSASAQRSCSFSIFRRRFLRYTCIEYS